MLLLQKLKAFFSVENDNRLSDTFVYLIRAAEEEPSVRETLLKILTQEPLKRRRAIRNLIEELRRKSAPEEFIKAIAYLTDDAIADAALEKIKASAK